VITALTLLFNLFTAAPSPACCFLPCSPPPAALFPTALVLLGASRCARKRCGSTREAGTRQHSEDLLL
jgi:hypothetical protein